MKFIIPLKREDLQSVPENEWEFYVKETYTIRELKTKLKGVELQAQRHGCKFIIENGFEILYSALSHFDKELPDDCKESALIILREGMDSLVRELDGVLTLDSGNLSTSEKETWLNKMKMIVYLFSQLIELLESNDNSSSDALFSKGRGKKGGKNSNSGKMTTIWDVDTKLACVTLFYRLLNLNVSMLFTPPVVEREFVNVIACALFRLFENPTIAHQRSKDLRGSISQVLGTLNNKYGYSLSCRLKIVQSLRHFEHVAIPFAEAVDSFVCDYNCSTMVLEIVRDLSQIDPNELARDTSATRAYAGFLLELSERQPEKIKSCLSLLMTHLEGDSPTMRKCVLSVIGEIIVRTLSGEGLDETSKETRDQFLDCLEDHIHDVHAHVRSSTLQVFGKLCQDQKAIPLARQQRLLQLVIGRLHDKSSNVRKQAVQLLTTLLQCNPFAASMPLEELSNQLKQELEKLEKIEPDEAKEIRKREVEWETLSEEMVKALKDKIGQGDDLEEVWDNAAKNEIIVRIQHLLSKRKFEKVKSLMLSAREHFPDDDMFGIDDGEELNMAVLRDIYVTGAKIESADLSQASQSQEEVNEVTRQRIIVSYLQDSVNFAKEVEKALPTVCILLGSKQNTDILEAINFFVSAFEFGVVSAMVGVRQMLALIWSQEAQVKEAVLNAYKRLYIKSGDEKTSSIAKANQIVKNFIALIHGATVGELTSLEELVSHLVKNGDIGKDVFQVLWQYFTKSRSEESRNALILLGMVGNSEPTVISSNLKIIIDNAFPAEKEEQDLRLMHEACVAISKMANIKKEFSDPPLRLDNEHELFSTLRSALVNCISANFDQSFFTPMSQKAILVIYSLAESPDTICGNIVKEVYKKIFPRPSAIVLSRFLALLGHIAVCQVNYLDGAVLSELKRRKHLRDQKKEKKKMDKRISINPNRRFSQGRKPSQDEHDELELIGAEADDAEWEYVQKVLENGILCSGNLLQLFAPLIKAICIHPEKYKNRKVRSAASLSLAKLMLISSRFCEDNLQLLFTLMEKSSDPTIRANLIIASGDLSFRFPNTMEPWTPHMYSRLRDPHPLVRSNTLTVLTHLILNDMIKVKGQISDMAKCISDSNEKISGLAKHFFTELAQKGNALYNVMPDIISRLSAGEETIKETEFRFVMGFIVGLIEKDKHLEALVEKLCHRFRATNSERQWRDLAYCLSLFNFSDKAIKKLSDNFTCYDDKLHIEEVYASLSGILVQSRKMAKNDTKLIIDELEELLAKAHEKCMEDHLADTRAKGAKQGNKRKSIKEHNDEDIDLESQEAEEKDDVSEDLNDEEVDENNTEDDNEEEIKDEGNSSEIKSSQRSRRGKPDKIEENDENAEMPPPPRSSKRSKQKTASTVEKTENSSRRSERTSRRKK